MISDERQNELSRLLTVDVDPSRDIYPFKGIELTREDVVWLLENHPQDLDLRGANLRQVNLSGLTFHRLHGGLTNNEEMQIADQGRREEAVQVAAIQMQGANLRSTRFIEATLNHAHLEGADLTEVRLISCELMHAHLDQARLNAAQIISCHLEYAHLSGGHVIGANFEYVFLSDARADEATFRSTHFEHVQFIESELGFADFRNAYLEYADFYHAQAPNAIFEGSDICHADFRFANLADSRLKSVCAEQALFSHAILRRADLSGAWLEFVQLANAQCAGADLRSANLNGANCQSTDFSGADFREAFLFGTNFNKCILNDAYMGNIGIGALCINKKSHALLWQTDLRRAIFDSATRLELPLVKRNMERKNLRNLEKWRSDLANRLGITLLIPTSMTTPPFLRTGMQYVLLADAQWNDASLHSIEWRHIYTLGDELLARQSKYRNIDQVREAVKAYYQLSVELHTQGQDPEAGQFEFRAQLLQRRILRLKGILGLRIGAYLISLLIDLLTGYGYKLERSILAYVILNAFFSGAYLYLGMIDNIHINLLEAISLSISSFHGRGIAQQSINLHDSELAVSSIEAVVGFLIEISFIVTYTKRLFRR